MAKRNNNSNRNNNKSSSIPVPSKKPSGRSPSVDTSGVTSTPVRNTSVPRNASAAAATSRPATPPAPRQITTEMIARRAYEIWQRGHGGSERDNWFQAERELRGQ